MIPAFRDDGWLPEGHHQASWTEIANVFGGSKDSRRGVLTEQLLALRDALHSHGVSGTLLLDGSYISQKPEPADFDVLLIGPSEIQVNKDGDESLAQLLDAESAEYDRGYSLFYIPNNSPALALLTTMWDVSKEGAREGVIEVSL